MDRRDIEIDKKFADMQERIASNHKTLDDRIAATHKELDNRIATATQQTDARLRVMEHRLNHAEGLLRTGAGAASTTASSTDIRSRKVVVIGGWDEDTDATRMKEEAIDWLSRQGIQYDKLYAPAPRHRIMKRVFKDCASAWKFLDSGPQWQGHWFNIERTCEEAARRRPVLMALDAVKEMITDPTMKIQHDVNRGIIWINGKRVAARSPDDIIEWLDNDFLQVTQAKERHARLLARGRSM